MLEPEQAQKLLTICASAREAHFRIQRPAAYLKTVSVAKRDANRPEIVAILQNQEPLWPPGTCNEGLEVWTAARAWYAFETYTDKPKRRPKLA